VLDVDVGAGTGAVSSALAARRARPVAVDLSIDMLAWNARAGPPCVVADIRALPSAAGRVDASVAAFVLNHLTEPLGGLAELARVTRPGGAVLAAVFSNASRSQARDRGRRGRSGCGLAARPAGSYPFRGAATPASRRNPLAARARHGKLRSLGRDGGPACRSARRSRADRVGEDLGGPWGQSRFRARLTGR